MTHHRQHDEVRLDIGDVREEDETLMWRQISRTRHRHGELQGRDIVVENFKDKTVTRA
mgnify:CR=1 FL=1